MLKRTLLLITALQIHSVISPAVQKSFKIQLSSGKSATASYDRINKTLQVTSNKDNVTNYSNVIVSNSPSGARGKMLNGQPYIGLERLTDGTKSLGSGRVNYYYGTKTTSWE